MTESSFPTLFQSDFDSVLDLSNLQTFTVDDPANSTHTIQARFSGAIDLSGLTTIDSVSEATINFTAENADSVIDLIGLTNFDDTKVNFNEVSGGVINLPDP